MRKHRLYWFVLAGLAALGVVLPRPFDTDHHTIHTTGTSRAAGRATGTISSTTGHAARSDPAASTTPAPLWSHLTIAAAADTRQAAGAAMANATAAVRNLPPATAEKLVHYVSAVKWQQEVALIELYDMQQLAHAAAARSAAQAAAAQEGSTDAATIGGPWAALRQCESGGNYAEDSGNGYYGAYQFSLATWRGLGYSGYPDQAPPALQDQAAQQLQARSGWGQWPACSEKLGL